MNHRHDGGVTSLPRMHSLVTHTFTSQCRVRSRYFFKAHFCSCPIIVVDTQIWMVLQAQLSVGIFYLHFVIIVVAILVIPTPVCTHNYIDTETEHKE